MGLADLATQTLRVIEEGAYVAPSGRRVHLRAAIDAAVAGTRLVTPSDAEALVAAARPGPHRTLVEVTDEGTAEAARRCVAGGDRVLALNFASARNVGGGFLGGARAQEEELCRASALYPCLASQPTYYRANRDERSATYTDHALLSPDVPFFRDADRALVEAPWLVTVLTSPAPNTGAVLQVDPGAADALSRTFRRRAAQVLAIAADAGHEVLVLGAWGCGAFQGDPTLVAQVFAEALAGPFAGVFRRVVFAVLVRSARDGRNLAAFQARFPT